jgi:serine/threonine-protein kinase
MKQCLKCGSKFVGEELFCPTDGTKLEEISFQDIKLSEGTIIGGRYRLEEKLGEGGMGVVYTARHVDIGKKVAIKILRSELSKEEEAIARFKQEARAATAIGHEHIVDITDFGTLSDGRLYFVMEYLDGQSLSEVLKQEGAFELQRALTIGIQIAKALEAAHNQGIIHRDLKPDNIFLVQKEEESDFVKILDFGIAKVGGVVGKLTRTGMVFGTPHYMSPEQATGTGVDHHTDIYALGVMLYEMLGGRVPFDADSYMGVLTKQLFEAPKSLREVNPKADIPPKLDELILKTLAKKKEDRPRSMTELKENLKKFVSAATEPLFLIETQESKDIEPIVKAPPPFKKEITPLSESKDIILQIPKSKSPIIIIFSLFLLVAVSVILFFYLKRETPSLTVKKEKIIKKRQSITPVQTIKPSAQKQKDKIILKTTIQSIPQGAEIYLGKELIGKTPKEIERPLDDQPKIYVIKKRGYLPRQIKINKDSLKELTVRLIPRRVKVKKKKPALPEKKPEPIKKLPGTIKKLEDGIRDPWAE